MRRLLIAGLLVLTGVSGTWGQALTGRVSATAAGGTRTNTYLDTRLRTWHTPAETAFLDLHSSAALAWHGGRTAAQISLSGLSGLLSGTASSRARVASAAFNGSYRLSPSWTLGPLAGVRSVELIQQRTTGWLGGFVRWHPGGGFTLDLQPAWSTQTVTDSLGGETRYRSLTGLARATYWPSGRWRLRATGFLSDSDSPAGGTAYQGTGGEGAITYWPAPVWRLRLSAGVQRIDYRFTNTDFGGGTTTSSATQLLTDGDLELTRTVGDRVELFGRAGVLGYESGGTTAGISTDWQVGAGVRVDLGATLWQPDRAETGRIWRSVEDGVRFEISYEGPGRLFLTGSFNDWAEPGRALEERGDGTWTATVPLSDGRYEYAIRVVGDADRQWLELPESALTVEDGFGRENGVLYVGSRE